MKTTIELPDALFALAKRVALERGTTLRALIEEGLERVVGGVSQRAEPLEMVTFGDAFEPLPELGWGHHGSPDTDNAAYVAKRLGVETSLPRPADDRG